LHPVDVGLKQANHGAGPKPAAGNRREREEAAGQDIENIRATMEPASA